jgi:hypothetical protein
MSIHPQVSRAFETLFSINPLPSAVQQHESGGGGGPGGCDVQRRQAADRVSHKHRWFPDDVVDEVDDLRTATKVSAARGVLSLTNEGA